MKHLYKQVTLVLIALLVGTGTLFAQQTRDLQFFRYPDQRGINMFEAPFQTDVEFDGVQVRLGGASTLQFQGITQDNTAGTLSELESNFNLATANLDFDVALENGLRMHLRTYLSSQHHPEAWVKSGYLQVDRLDFIQEDLMSDLMDKVRIKLGHMEINYGDAHFRRTDNAMALYNPFAGNYLMDSFSTEVAGELYYYDYNKGILVMIGLSNGKLNQSVVASEPETTPNFYGKLGYDKQMNDDMRFRLTASFLTSGESGSLYLYSGDRAGSRYYSVMDEGFRSGRFAPDYTVSGFAPGGPIAGEMTSFMINPFVKFQGLEFFGLYENVSGKRATETDTRTFNQYGAEVLYRFGAGEDFYLGGRYNLVEGTTVGGDIEISRLNIGGGWFLTKNVLTKLEYVTQSYDGDGYTGSKYEGGEFNGIMLEAAISF